MSSNASIRENSTVFGLWSSTWGIGVDSVVLFSTSSTLWSGVSRSISTVGSTCLSLAPSLVLFSVLLLVLTMLTEKLSFVFFGPIDVVPRSDELYFVFDPVDLLSSTGTLLRLIFSIYNCSYLQYYYIHRSILRIKSFLRKKLLKEIYHVIKTESCSVLNCLETLIVFFNPILVPSQDLLCTVSRLSSTVPVLFVSVPRPLSQD